MAESDAARPYAQALLEVASAQRATSRVRDELAKVAGWISESSEFREFLRSPVIEEDERKAVVRDLCQRALFSKLTTNFLLLLGQKKRLRILEDIISAFGRLADEADGVMRAHAYAPLKLSAVQVSRLRAALEEMTGKKVVVEDAVDDSLMGGLVVKLGGRVYDSSVKTQLAVLKENVLRI